MPLDEGSEGIALVPCDPQEGIRLVGGKRGVSGLPEGLTSELNL